MEELLGRPFTVLLPEQAHARVRTLTAGVLDVPGALRDGDAAAIVLAGAPAREDVPAEDSFHFPGGLKDVATERPDVRRAERQLAAQTAQAFFRRR